MVGESFLSAYKKYWNQARDDKYGNETSDFTHKLYTEAMDLPVKGRTDEVLGGLVTRRRYEWTLFECGYYTNIGEFCIESSSEVDSCYSSTYTSSITGRIFKEFKQNAPNYSYPDISSVNADWGTECGTVSTMILGSGYNGNISMRTGANELIENGGLTYLGVFLRDFTGKDIKYSTVYSVEDFANKLKEGCVAIIHNPDYSSAGHYLTVLDISSDSKEVYISNPDYYNTPSNGATYQGWNDIEAVYNVIDSIMFIEN